MVLVLKLCHGVLARPSLHNVPQGLGSPVLDLEIAFCLHQVVFQLLNLRQRKWRDVTEFTVSCNVMFLKRH